MGHILNLKTGLTHANSCNAGRDGRSSLRASFREFLKITPRFVDLILVKPQKRIRVLIADDDHQLSRRLADYVSDRGFDARVVSNGKDARSQILEWKPRYVLADLMLPDGNALSLIDFIKGESSLRHQFIHVLVMSGHNVQANVQQALRHGAKDYIVKPFRHE